MLLAANARLIRPRIGKLLCAVLRRFIFHRTDADNLEHAVILG